MSSVFLSHSSKDKEFVRELYDRLQRDGVKCFFDTESIGWGSNWVRALERAVDECTDIVFVLSPDFCSSEWVEVERTSSIADDPSGLKRKIRPLLLRECQQLTTFPRFLKHVQMIDVSTTALFEANYPKICQALGGVVTQDMGKADRNVLPPVQPLPTRNNLGYHSLRDQFVGRVDALWQIYDKLHQGNTAIVQGVGVVAGTGGLGKSQTAIEYAHRFGAGYHGAVYWVDADRGRATMIAQIADTAGITIDAKADEKKQMQQLWTGLNQLPPSLLVLDNFPEEVPLRPYLPPTGRIHTLVTTRRRDITNHPYVLLDMLSSEAGIQLLQSGARRLKHEEAARLVERLGGLPLALELTKGFLNYRTDVSVSQVLEEMEASGEISVLQGFTAKYGDELPSGHETDVARTFQMSWELTPPAGKDVLRIMAELAPFPVPVAILRRIGGFEEAKGLDDEFGESLSELSRLSLVELDSERNPVMHRLIHAFVRYRNQVDQASPLERTATVVREEMNEAFGNPDAVVLRELEQLLPHAEALVSSNRLTDEDAVSLMSCIGWQHSSLGRYSTARKSLERALQKAEQSFAPGHPSIARSQSNLALVLKDLGQLEEARDLLRQALASDEQSFAPGHPSIAIRQSNLATVLRGLGQLEEARDLLRQALAAAEQSFTPGHPSIAIRQSNLATVLQDLGQLEEACDLLQEALGAMEKLFTPDHPSVAIVRSNLAAALQELGTNRH